MIKMQDLAKYNALMLRDYISDISNYTCTTMKQHNVLLVTMPSDIDSDSTALEYNSLVDEFMPQSAYRADAKLFVTTKNVTRVYHDAGYYTMMLPRAVDACCELTTGEPVLGKYCFTPYLDIPYIDPTIAIWKETTKKYWVLPIPLTKAFVKDILYKTLSTITSRLSCLYIICEDNMGIPDTTRFSFVTPQQFKNIYNYASMQAIVKDVDEYIRNLAIRACSLKTNLREEYKRAYNSLAIEPEKAAALVIEPFIPITSECISIDEKCNSLDRLNAPVYLYQTHPYVHPIDNPDGMSAPLEVSYRPSRFYSYGAKDKGAKYGKMFLDKKAIIPTLKNILASKKSIPVDCLIYASLRFSTTIRGYRGYLSSLSYTGIWADNSIVFNGDSYDQRDKTYLKLQVTPTEVEFSAILDENDTDLTSVVKMTVSEYIDLLDYLDKAIMAHNPDITAGHISSTINSLGDLFLYAINNTCNLRYGPNILGKKYAFAPSKFILGNPVLKRIHTVMTQEKPCDICEDDKSPWRSYAAFDLAQVLDYKIKPDSPEVVEACHSVIANLIHRLANAKYENSSVYTPEAPLIYRTSSISVRLGGYGTFSNLKPPVKRGVLADITAKPTRIDSFDIEDSAHIEPLGNTGIVYKAQLGYITATPAPSSHAYKYLDDAEEYRLDIQITIPHILLPYAEIKITNQVLPDSQISLYSLDKYEKYLNTGKARLSRERAYLVSEKAYEALTDACVLYSAFNSIKMWLSSLGEHYYSAPSHFGTFREYQSFSYDTYCASQPNDRDYLSTIRS